MEPTGVEADAGVTGASGVLSDGTVMWRYVMRPTSKSGGGWAIILLDSHGLLSVNSDYGRYVYQWTGFGTCFRSFLVGCDAEYVLRKVAPQRIWAGDETLQAVKERLAEGEREGAIDAGKARSELDLLHEYGELHRSEDFAMWLEHTKIPDAHHLGRTEYDPLARAFVRHALPRLQAFLRQELGAARVSE